MNMNHSNKDLSSRAGKLADRILQGANLLAKFSESLSDDDWNKEVKGDGRTVGVVIHHVASVYPLEVELAQVLAGGKPIEGATKAVIDKMNADHARDHADVGKAETLALLKQNSRAAAEAVRSFSDAELDNSATVSLNYNAPLTAQFFIEDHALRHSFNHLAKIKASF